MAIISPERAAELVPQLSRLTPGRLQAYVDAASNAIEAACGRKFARATVANELIRTDTYGCAWLERTPVVTGSLSLVDLNDEPISRWRLDTETGELNVSSQRSRELYASYDGGFDHIPAEIELAVATLAKVDSDRSSSQASGEIASKEIGKVKVAYANLSTMQAIPAIPKFVMDLISPYVMPRLI